MRHWPCVQDPRAQGEGLRRLVSPPSNPQSPAAQTPGTTPQPQFAPWGPEASGKSSLGSHLRKAKPSSALALALLPEPPLPLCEPALSSPWKLPGAWHDSRVSSQLRPLLQSELPSSSTLWTPRHSPANLYSNFW